MPDNDIQPMFIAGMMVIYVDEPKQLQEEWIPERQIKETENKKLIVYDKGFRYRAKFVYDALSVKEYEKWVILFNMKLTLMFFPNKQHYMREYDVRITSKFFFPYLADRFIAYKGEIVLEGTSLTKEITYRYDEES